MFDLYFVVSNILVVISFILLVVLFLVRDQSARLNWSIFFSSLYILITLPVINRICVHVNLWTFSDLVSNSLHLPYNLFFLWIMIWSVIPIYIWKGRYIWIIALALFWLDILFMPLLAQLGVLELHKYWIIGDFILILFVFVPAYFWAYCYYFQKYLAIRALFQVIVVIIFIVVGIPFLLMEYNLIQSIEYTSRPVLFQITFIIGLPGLIAVKDLVIKGDGTPFPYDPTKNLVRTGVYAYIQNPIQWSFTFIFIPMCIYFSSYMPLIGSFVSIAYIYGVSNWHEYSDMENRFGESWIAYKNNVPKWYFLIKPTSIPKGQIYFDMDCQQCSDICEWFQKANTINLEILPAHLYDGKPLEAVTYIDEHSIHYKGVEGIASALEHINLAYASLGWFLRLPGINELVQIIVDSMGIGVKRDYC